MGTQNRLEGDMIYKRYCRVQMWKKMYNKLHYGVADRPLNFNKVNRGWRVAGGGCGVSSFHLTLFAQFDRPDAQPFFRTRSVV